MESITKNRQTAAVLKRLIARAYGEGLVPDGEDFASELGHGWFNVAYVISLRDGRRVVLKIAPPRGIPVMTYEHEMMRNELAALALVHEHTSVPAPAIEYVDTSGELIDADWFFMSYVDGDNLGVLLEQGVVARERSGDYLQQLGALNRALNAIVGDHFGPLRGPGFTTWRDAFLSMIEDVLRDGERGGLDLGWDYALVREIIATDADALDEVVQPRFVEWDLWASNVMVRDERIVGIIDHERAFYGDPLIEAGFTALDLPAFGSADDFVRGYGLGELDDDARRRRRLYTLYLVLVMIIETHYRGHEDPWQYDFARERLTELMAQYGHDRTPQPARRTR